jgi:ABC-type lipoprotein release transport system permease subunit
MRIATYLALVVRRVWAKKGILFGSLLGATLVVALLVVVPLYEASVLAVDLAFTVDTALDEEVDVEAFSAVAPSYTASTGEFNRTIMAGAQQQWLQPWYPSMEERSQTREFLVIPSGPDEFIDYLALAEEWQTAFNDAVEREAPAEEYPSPQYPTPPREATQFRIFTSPDLSDQLTVIAGDYIDDATVSSSSYTPLKVMIGEGLAAVTSSEVGDTFFIRPFSGLATVFEYVEVAGIVTATDPTANIWSGDNPASMLYLTQDVFDEWLAPVAIDPQVDPWMRSTRGLPETAVTQRWRLPLERDLVELEELTEFQSRLSQFSAQVSRESSGAIPTTTFINNLINEFNTRSVVVGGPILAMLALVVGGAIYFLVYTAAMTVEREGSEIALLKTRGASSAQTIGIHMGQSLVIAVAAALLAPLVARWLVGFTGRIPPLSTLTGGEPLEVTQQRSVLPFMIIGGILTFVAMGVAIMPYARRGVLALRSLAARPGTQSVWQKYNLDLFAIALSLVMLFQLRLRGFINQTTGEATLDPLAIMFPALLLFTGALILLRIFPYVLKLVGWLLTKPRSMATALTGWHLGRNPVPYGRLALLVWVTTGLGAFALTYAATLENSYQDRAAFAAGADVRIVGEDAGYSSVPDGSIGTPVLRTTGAPRLSTVRAQVLAIDPAGFSQVVKWRSDFGAEDPNEIFSLLRPDGRVPDVGVEIPEGATHIQMDGVMIPQTLAAEQTDPDTTSRDHRLILKVIDARTRVWTMLADVDFTDGEWRTVSVDLSTGRNAYSEPPEPPLSIQAMWIEKSDIRDGFAVDGGELIWQNIRAVGPNGDTPLDLSEMSATGGLIVTDTDASEALDYRFSVLPPDQSPPTAQELAASPLNRDGPAVKWGLPANTRRSNPIVPHMRRIPEDILVLVDGEAGARSGLNPGDMSTYTVDELVLDGELVGYVDKIPTATDPRREGLMVVDIVALNAWANGAATWSFSGPLTRVKSPGELWVETEDPDAVVRIAGAQMPEEPDQVFTVGKSEAAFSSRPVQVGLVAILFVGAAVGVVLALAGVTGYVLLAVSRRAREMGVLRALGFERTSVGLTFALEQLVVIGLGAAIGILGGVALVMVMLPFLQLGETAAVIEPPILISIPVPQLVGYVALVGVLLIVSVLWATRRVSVRRMSEVLREVER